MFTFRSIIGLSALAAAAHAHGYLSVPPARNINDYCKQVNSTVRVSFVSNAESCAFAQ